MEREITILKRKINSSDIALINTLIEKHGKRGRTYISKQLCRIWDWRTASGVYRDIVCRDLLRRLEKRGMIQLPPPLTAARKPGYTNKVKLPKGFKYTPINQSLNQFSEIEFFMIRGTSQEGFYNSLIHSFHYLRYHQGSGEQLKYLVKADGDVVACIGFGGAAYKVGARDGYIGWDQRQREQNLSMVVNNTRFLILPWVRVPNLASFILGHISRQIAGDWRTYYRHEIVLMETFVERERFRGSCYKAANWKHIGHTKGRGRNDSYKRNSLPVKDIYIYPLVKDFRERLLVCTD
ncbi:MAG: hypothetical protein DRI88_11775 [Bacteroidetes bacterium]|nr:MAG: hypothetical protein DRI88_11775 [Bacteroidota bacterium]